MNPYTYVYLSGYHMGLQKRAGLLDSLRDYQPISEENVARTGRWLGGGSGGIVGALLGGTVGTIAGLAGGDRDPKTKEKKEKWFVRGLKGGAKGTAIGTGIGAGLGILGGHVGLPTVVDGAGEVFAQTGQLGGLEAKDLPVEMRRGMWNSMRKLTPRDIEVFGTDPPRQEDGVMGLFLWSLRHPEMAKRLGGPFLSGGKKYLFVR